MFVFVALYFNTAIFGIGFYAIEYGSSILSGIWIFTFIWEFIVSCINCMYICCKCEESYKFLMIVRSVSVGALLFISILLINPCGLILSNTDTCQLKSIINEDEVEFWEEIK